MSEDPAGRLSEHGRQDLSRGPGDGEPAVEATGAAGFLTRLASSMSFRSDAGSVAEAILSEVAGILPVRAWLICWDEERRRAAWLPQGGGQPFPARLLADKGSLVRSVLQRGGDRVVPDLDSAEDFPERRYLHRSGGAWAFLPLEASGRSMACLVLRGSGPADLSEAHLHPLRSALPATAMLLRASLLQREMEAKVEERTLELSLFYDISRSLGFVLNPDELVQLVGSSLRRALDLDVYALSLLFPENRRTTLQLYAPVAKEAVAWFHAEVLKEMEKLTGQNPGLLLVVGSEEPARGAVPVAAGDLRSVAHVPLFIRGQIVGCLSVGARAENAFAEGKMRLMYTIANQASLTLDRLRTAHEAEASKIHSMLESMAEGVLLLDGDLRVAMSNPAAQCYLAAIRGEPLQETLTRLGDTDLRALMAALGRQEARSRTFEVAVTAEGKIYSITCSPVRGLGGAVQGMVVVVSDVTEARQRQMQFAQSEKLSALGEMISGVAHELNNPLASVMGYAQLLQDKQVDEDIRKKLRAIDAEATRCRRIVQNLLRFARHHTPEQSLLDVNAAIDSVLQLLGHQLEVDGIDVRLDLSPALPPVMGDFHLLQQVFLNIIHNAYQAMKERGGSGLLIVRTSSQGKSVIAEFTDNGPGIAPHNLERIFDPFFSTKEVGKGTGLGLSLAYGTVRQHGGTIMARSRLGAGSTFIVDLPSAPAEAFVGAAQQPAHDAGAEPGAAGVADAPREAAAPDRRRRILVVEDEGPLAEVVAEALQAQGHRVDTAGDGRTAKARISEAAYDLIISDLKMPNMNGRDLYKHVADVNPSLARRIIFSTGDTANPDARAFFEEVGNPFLSKPFNLRDLIRVVDSVLAEG